MCKGGFKRAILREWSKMTDAVTLTWWRECIIIAIITTTNIEGAIRMDRATFALDARMTETDITLAFSGIGALRTDLIEGVVDGMDCAMVAEDRILCHAGTDTELHYSGVATGFIGKMGGGTSE